MTDELKKTQDEFEAAVREMTASLKQTAEAVKPPAPPAATVDLSPDGLTKLAQEKGVGAALQAVGMGVLAPMQAEAYDLAIKSQRRSVERDAELGKWAKKHAKEIDAAIKADPARVANEGVDEIVRKMRDGDDEYRTERVEAEVTRRLAEERAKTAPVNPPLPVTPGVRPPVDRPAGAPAAAPTPSTPDIAAVEVPPESFEVFQGLVEGGTEEDFKRERLAMQQAEKTLGKAGLRKAGGYPICAIEDIAHAGEKGYVRH